MERWADPNAKVSHEEVQKLIKQHQQQQQRENASGDSSSGDVSSAAETSSSPAWQIKVDVQSLANDNSTAASSKRVFPGAGVLSPSVDPISFIR